jgi:DNA recombination protein RmuC
MAQSSNFISIFLDRLLQGQLSHAETLALVFGLLALVLVIAILRGQGTKRALAEEAAAAAERQRELDDKVALLLQAQAQISGRVSQIGESFESRQTNLARLLAERIDSLNSRLGDGLKENATSTIENLAKLNERLSLIDQAQKNLTHLTSEVLTLKDILANKQARGAFGQGRMEAIVKDGLPHGAYEFQATLSNRSRPDCLIHLPGDNRPLVVDAKFPLEGFSAFREARLEDERKNAAARVRQDMQTHVKDVASKYLIPGETQDIAILFVPSESIYADLMEYFDDLVQKAHRARVLVVSPSLLTMAIQVTQALVRDAKMREAAHLIQDEVRKILDDVTRMRERVSKLETHFRQANDDVAAIITSADKVSKRGQKIEAMEFRETPAAASAPPIPARPGEGGLFPLDQRQTMR